MGAMLVPLSFLTVWEMTFSLPAATFAGLLILFGNIPFVKLDEIRPHHQDYFLFSDHGMLTLNRYILLDPILLFFISSSVYAMVKFHNQRHKYIQIT